MKTRCSKRRLGQKGFTLMEMMVVLGLIALVAAAAIPALARAVGKGRITDAVASLQTATQLVESYCSTRPPDAPINPAVTALPQVSSYGAAIQATATDLTCNNIALRVIPHGDIQLPTICARKLSGRDLELAWRDGSGRWRDGDMPFANATGTGAFACPAT